MFLEVLGINENVMEEHHYSCVQHVMKDMIYHEGSGNEEWQFLFVLILHLGFGPNFLLALRAISSTASSAILINRRRTHLFKSPDLLGRVAHSPHYYSFLLLMFLVDGLLKKSFGTILSDCTYQRLASMKCMGCTLMTLT